MRVLYTGFLVLWLCGGCQHMQSHGEGEPPTYLDLTNEQISRLRFQITPDKADVVLSSGFRPRQISLAEASLFINVHASITVELSLQNTPYCAIFARQQQQVKKLQEYRSSATIPSKNLYFDLREFNEDTDWLIFQEELSAVEQRQIAESVRPATKGIVVETDIASLASNSLGFCLWNIYRVEGKKPRLLARIKVVHTPVAVDMLVKKSGQPSFEKFLFERESVRQNDRFKLRLRAYEKTHVAIFLADQSSVYQLFPRERTPTTALEQNQVRFVPDRDSFTFDANIGRENLYIFYDDSPIACEQARLWLEDSLLPQTKGMLGIKPVEKRPLPPTSFYCIGYDHLR